LRRDSSRRCWNTGSGWLAAHRSGGNTSATVRAERYSVVEGKTPEIQRKQAETLLKSIETTYEVNSEIIPDVEGTPGTATDAGRGPGYHARQGWFGQTVTLFLALPMQLGGRLVSADDKRRSRVGRSFPGPCGSPTRSDPSAGETDGQATSTARAVPVTRGPSQTLEQPGHLAPAGRGAKPLIKDPGDPLTGPGVSRKP
jgi:hypothetical protein